MCTLAINCLLSFAWMARLELDRTLAPEKDATLTDGVH
jgi:hypothetical protein